MCFPPLALRRPPSIERRCVPLLRLLLVLLLLAGAAAAYGGGGGGRRLGGGAIGVGDAGAVDARTLRTFSAARKGVGLCPCQACTGGVCTNCTAGFNDTAGCADAAAFEVEMMAVTAPPPAPAGGTGARDYDSGSSADCDDEPAVHTLRLMWVTGDLIWPAFGNVTMRVYVDGEAVPSLEFKVYEAQALADGWDQEESKTYGNRFMGKGALFGGLYLAMPVPFSSSVRVTAQLPDADIRTGARRGFYFVGRGLFGMPAFIDGNIRLPATARLRLTRTAATYEGRSSALLLNRSNTTGGAVFLVTLAASSQLSHFLEGEVSALIDGQQPPLLLSSGTEDYFLSAQYFDAGAFHNPLSGCTHLSLGCLDSLSECRMAAYRFHDADPIFWSRDIALRWAIGDDHWKVDPTHAVAMVWTYEW